MSPQVGPRRRWCSSLASTLASPIACFSGRSLNNAAPSWQTLQSPEADGLSEIVSMNSSPLRVHDDGAAKGSQPSLYPEHRQGVTQGTRDMSAKSYSRRKGFRRAPIHGAARRGSGSSPLLAP